MRKKYIAVFAFLILALTAGFNVVRALADWKTMTTVTGNTDQTTGYFNVPTNRWRIVWTITPNDINSGFGVLHAFVYSKGESAICVSSFAGNSTCQNGTTYIHEGSKEYYLKLSAANLQNYTIKIEYDAYAIPEYSTVAVIFILALVSASVITARKKLSNKRAINF